MKRPLYVGHNPTKGQQGHAGLWYEKYCDQWRDDGPMKWNLSAKDKQTPKVDWVKTVVTGDQAIGHATTALLLEHHARMDKLCGLGGVHQVFQTSSRLVIGIGQDHPIENGFLWHPTLGVPYIPGSSIKGMLRNWVLTWVPTLEDKDERTRWFEGIQDKSAGEFIFLDALPLNVPALEADIITPHHSPYYHEPLKNPPADWYGPTPTPFLTVAMGATFAIRVLQRRSKAGDTTDLSPLLQMLTDAFDTLGIGAKTAAGYGRLIPVNSKRESAAPPTDALQDFKAFCARFLPLANHKGDHVSLVTALEKLPEGIRILAIQYLRNQPKVKVGDCTQALADLLFPKKGLLP